MYDMGRMTQVKGSEEVYVYSIMNVILTCLFRLQLIVDFKLEFINHIYMSMN